MQAEPRTAAPKKPRRFSFGFGTAVAAVAAIFLLAVGSGKLPQLGAGRAMLNDAAVKSADAEPAEIAAEESAEFAAEEPAAAAETDTPAAAEPEAMYAAGTQLNRMPANVDCAALARAENRPVGLLYADPAELPELDGAPSLPLDGGTRYEVTQKSLDALALRFDDLQVFEPEGYLPEEDHPAYLIVVEQ